MTYRELLNRLIDLKALAMPPEPGERGGCMSSYDRSSQYDQVAARYVNWDANDDGSGCVRRLDDGSIVAFEQEGPGVIWRVWSALPESGHIRVYIDGRETPAVDMPFIDWFERMPGEVPPLNFSELSLRLSRGRNSFIPIPYQRSCRVELAPGWGAYYHFTYTRFPDGTQMPAYEERFTRESCVALAELDRMLYARGETHIPGEKQICEAEIMPGEEALLCEKTGCGALAELAVDAARLSTDCALGNLRLRIHWDEDEEASVDASLGAFFGGSPDYARLRTLPLTMEKGRFACRFYMPFHKGMRLTIENRTARKETLSLRLTFADEPDAANLMRFHAREHEGDWRDLNAARFAPHGDRWPDWPLLVTGGGPGRFVGVHLNILCTWPRPIRQAETWWVGQWDKKTVDWWWGEGDEKFFVDGEAFPSTFGTGSEDYIGYAWAAEPPFALFESSFAAMNAMPLDGNGITSVMRFHVADNIPFQRRFEGFIEKYKADEWGEGGVCRYCAVPYWYEARGRHGM